MQHTVANGFAAHDDEDVTALWVANTSLSVDISMHRTQLIAHRRVHHIYAAIDYSNDVYHAAPVEPIAHGLVQSTLS